MVTIATRWQILEGIIERSVKSFVDVGNALLTIRDSKLYREQYRNFKDYCTEKWGMGRQYSYDVIRGAQVAVNLSARADNFTPLVKPVFERQVRPLAILNPAQQCEVWEEAVRSADGKVVTYKQVKALVAELVGPAPPAPPKKKDPYPESDAHAFATMAILQLERIRDDDPLRFEGVGRVSEWIQEILIKWKGK